MELDARRSVKGGNTGRIRSAHSQQSGRVWTNDWLWDFNFSGVRVPVGFSRWTQLPAVCNRLQQTPCDQRLEKDINDNVDPAPTANGIQMLWRLNLAVR